MSKEIVIQGIQEGKIIVNADGEIKEIQNELSELKSLLQSLSVQNVQYADKIYNIEHINEANFGFITGKQTFNEVLVKTLTETIAPYSVDAQKILNHVNKNQIRGWEGQIKYAKKAKEIIAYSFVGVLGIQLSQLMAIGSDPYSGVKLQIYIDKCLFIAKRSLELITYTFISELWEIQKKSDLVLTDASRKVLSAFFEDSFETDFLQKFILLKETFAVFIARGLALPYEEMQDFERYLQADSEFYQTLEKLKALDEKPNQDEFDLLECLEAEKNLSELLSYFSFLADYKMASIKQIGYKQVRNAHPNYLHRYTALGIDNKANQDAEKHLCVSHTITTDSVLIYKGDHYQKSINLFPFVIDYNALTFESGAKVCFYHHRHLSEENTLEYLFLEDESIQLVELKNILETFPNLNDLIADKDKFKLLNLDSVVEQFRAAQQQILGEEAGKNSEDDFEDLFE